MIYIIYFPLFLERERDQMGTKGEEKRDATVEADVRLFGLHIGDVSTALSCDS